MAFTVVGIMFIMIFGVELAYEEFFPAQEPELDGHPVRFNNSEIIPMVYGIAIELINTCFSSSYHFFQIEKFTLDYRRRSRWII